MTMLAYLNDPQLRADMLEEIELHQKQDQILQGTYGKENGQWKGCFVGCAIHSLNHKQGIKLEYIGHQYFPTHLGVPEQLAWLGDSIFEGLHEEEAKLFPLQFATEIRCGSDLSLVWPKFVVWMLEDASVFSVPKEVQSAVINVQNLYKEWVEIGTRPDQNRFNESAEYARSAAMSAAESARHATMSAATPAWYAAEYAEYAESARHATMSAARCARSARHAWQKMQDKLLELLAEAK